MSDCNVKRVKTMTPIEQYVYNYPQLTLPIKEGMSKSPEYTAIVRKGFLPSTRQLPVAITGQEELLTIATPAGEAQVLYLPDRNLFEYFIRVLAYRCEPAQIPRSTGAMLISGINNWRRIEAHKKEYLENGGDDWSAEFKKFSSVPGNYKDTVLLVSRGDYSALLAAMAGFPKEEWIDDSKTIRTYHELTHFVSRKLFPENQEALRDEIVADCIGILAAFGTYDDLLARKVLGIESDTYRSGGRLENYVDAAVLLEEAKRADDIISKLKVFSAEHPCAGNVSQKDLFDFLILVEKNRIGMVE